MAYNYLDEKQLRDALHDSEEHMKDHHDPLDELERITEGRPGKVPQGKPKVTDGTLAGYKRETPKQVIQRLPSGKVIIRKRRELEDQANAVLTDIILPNANAGGTPYDKAILAIEDVIAAGSSWAYCFFDRQGDLFHANYRLLYVKDVLFEQGKVSEFDTNFMPIVLWMTKADIKAKIWLCQQQQRWAKERGEQYTGTDNLKHWQELLDKGPAEKDDANKTSEEKRTNNNDGYFKVVRFLQRGTYATFYTYSPVIDKVLSTEVSRDPRGVMPVHGLIGAPSRSNPLGRPLASLSAGKQNLLDFRMQMEQYREGMQLSPPVKLWGQTKASAIQLVPDKIIKMKGTKANGDDFETVDIASSANRNYANDSSYIRTQIYNEQGGSNDTSVSSDAGSTGFSKTDTGVKAQTARTSVSKDHLRRLSENWHGRIFETLLNIQFAESRGQKALELEDETMQRLGLSEDPVMNYDEELGKIRYKVAGGTSEAEDNEQESEKLVALQDIRNNAQVIDTKFMNLYNQLVKNAGVDNAEKLMYTDAEIEFQTGQEEQAKQVAAQQAQMAQKQALNPQIEQPMPPTEAPMAIEQAAPDGVAEDRALALQTLTERGIPVEQAEQLLQAVDGGQV